MPYNAGPHNVRETPTVGAGTTAQRTVAAPGSVWINLDDPANPLWQRYDGATWIDISSSAPTLPAWALAGNTLSGGEKLGSTNSQPVVMYHNNVETLRLAAALVTAAAAVDFGIHLGKSVIKGSLDFDNSVNPAYIMQGALLLRSIKIPGTAGNAPWTVNNPSASGLEVVDSATPGNKIWFQPGNSRGIFLGVSGFSLPTHALKAIANSVADVTILLGDGVNTYTNNVGYNVKVLAGAGGSIGDKAGGNVHIAPGPGGGLGADGNIFLAHDGTNALGRVGVGTNALGASSMFQVDSTTGCFKPPRMNTVQRDAITAEAGDVIYNLTTTKHQGYNGATWNDFY